MSTPPHSPTAPPLLPTAYTDHPPLSSSPHPLDNLDIVSQVFHHFSTFDHSDSRYTDLINFSRVSRVWNEAANKLIYRHVIVGGDRGVDLSNPLVARYARVVTLLDHDEQQCPVIAVRDKVLGDNADDFLGSYLEVERVHTLVLKSPKLLHNHGPNGCCEAFFEIPYDYMIVYVGAQDTMIEEDDASENEHQPLEVDNETNLAAGHGIWDGCQGVTFVFGPNTKLASREARWVIDLVQEWIPIRLFLPLLPPVEWYDELRDYRGSFRDDTGARVVYPSSNDFKFIAEAMLACVQVITVKDESEPDFGDPPLRAVLYSNYIPTGPADDGWGEDPSSIKLNFEIEYQWLRKIEECEEETGETVSQERRENGPMGQMEVQKCSELDMTLDSLLRFCIE